MIFSFRKQKIGQEGEEGWGQEEAALFEGEEGHDWARVRRAYGM
uniref:Uncharacterized protein n=1 Tax=Meloidogyne hapla TaxID=6305 RepID=A0A1I8BFA4_MELHA